MSAYNLYFNPQNLLVEAEGERIDIACFDIVNQQLERELKLKVHKKSNVLLLVLVRLQNSSLKLVTLQDHIEEAGTSNLHCKTISNNTSHFSFFGRVKIHPGGNKSHAYQRNENLILDTNSEVTSEPSLEILANEVFCTHGAATSGLDVNQLYYLQTRGIEKERAQAVLVSGFLYSALDILLLQQNISARKLDELVDKINQFYHF